MNNDFILIKNMKLFINSLDSIVVNYPRKEMVIKNRLLNDSLDILELIFFANYLKDLEKKREIQMKILSKISMLDFYFERSFTNKYISEKVCKNKCGQLTRITKMVNGWIKSGS